MECSFALEQQDECKSIAAQKDNEIGNIQIVNGTNKNKNPSKETTDKKGTNKTRRGQGKKNKQKDKNESKNVDFSIIGSNKHFAGLI